MILFVISTPVFLPLYIVVNRQSSRALYFTLYLNNWIHGVEVVLALFIIYREAKATKERIGYVHLYVKIDFIFIS